MTDDELLVNLNDYYASIRATSERLEELKQIVDFSLNDIYEIN